MTAAATEPATDSAPDPTPGPFPDASLLRTFIAIELPSSILESLTTTQARVKELLRGQQQERALRWSPTQNLHLTLRFLGSTNARQRQLVIAQLQEVAAQTRPFRLQVDVSGKGLGAFPNMSQPRVLWAGVGGDLESLALLQAQVEAVAQNAGFSPEEKGYTPHLTLARAAREADRRVLSQVGQAIAGYARYSSMPGEMPGQEIPFEVDRLVYYQSELGAGASRYTALALLPLAAG